MYARLITAHIQPTKWEEFATAFSTVILPVISREHGFKSIYFRDRPLCFSQVTVLVH